MSCSECTEPMVLSDVESDHDETGWGGRCCQPKFSLVAARLVQQRYPASKRETAADDSPAQWQAPVKDVSKLSIGRHVGCDLPAAATGSGKANEAEDGPIGCTFVQEEEGSASFTLLVAHPHVSEQHVCITAHRTELPGDENGTGDVASIARVCDLGSLNGTFIQLKGEMGSARHSCVRIAPREAALVPISDGDGLVLWFGTPMARGSLKLVLRIGVPPSTTKKPSTAGECTAPSPGTKPRHDDAAITTTGTVNHHINNNMETTTEQNNLAATQEVQSRAVARAAKAQAAVRAVPEHKNDESDSDCVVVSPPLRAMKAGDQKTDGARLVKGSRTSEKPAEKPVKKDDTPKKTAKATKAAKQTAAKMDTRTSKAKKKEPVEEPAKKVGQPPMSEVNEEQTKKNNKAPASSSAEKTNAAAKNDVGLEGQGLTLPGQGVVIYASGWTPKPALRVSAQRLGVAFVDDVMSLQCTHIAYSDPIYRSIRLLCLLCTARFVVSENWLEDAVRKRCFELPPGGPRGAIAASGLTAIERQFKFSAADLLASPTELRRQLFSGMNFAVTSSVVPQEPRKKDNDIKNIIIAAGGKIVTQYNLATVVIATALDSLSGIKRRVAAQLNSPGKKPQFGMMTRGAAQRQQQLKELQHDAEGNGKVPVLTSEFVYCSVLRQRVLTDAREFLLGIVVKGADGGAGDGSPAGDVPPSPEVSPGRPCQEAKQQATGKAKQQVASRRVNQAAKGTTTIIERGRGAVRGKRQRDQS